MALPEVQKPIAIFQSKQQLIDQAGLSFPYFEVGVGRQGKIPSVVLQQYLDNGFLLCYLLNHVENGGCFGDD
jgi:hypothetical protein